jgi:hypothetical protein
MEFAQQRNAPAAPDAEEHRLDIMGGADESRPVDDVMGPPDDKSTEPDVMDSPGGPITES